MSSASAPLALAPLPTQCSSFVGRTAEIAGVDAIAALVDPFGDGDAERIVLVLENLQVVVMVADRLEAEDIAVELAEQQGACLTDEGACAVALLAVLQPNA